MTERLKPYILYCGGTPDGRKIRIFLEECRLPYKVRFVDLSKEAHLKVSFKKMSPNSTVPVLVDPEGPGEERLSIFDSAAILQYLGRKHGAFYPIRARTRVEVDQWLMFQTASLGPVSEFAFRFEDLSSEDINTQADGFFRNEILRLYDVLDTRLKGQDFITNEYSVADMAIFPWIVPNVITDDFAHLPNLQTWYRKMSERPAVQRSLPSS